MRSEEKAGLQQLKPNKPHFYLYYDCIELILCAYDKNGLGNGMKVDTRQKEDEILKNPR